MKSPAGRRIAERASLIVGTLLVPPATELLLKCPVGTPLGEQVGQLTGLDKPEWTSQDPRDEWTPTFNPKVPGSRPGGPRNPARRGSKSDFRSRAFDGPRSFEHLAKNGQYGPVLLATSRLFRSDDVGQARYIDLKVISQPLPRRAAP